MNPLSFAEFISVYDGNKYDGWKEYVLYGGLSPVVLLPTPEQKIELPKLVLTLLKKLRTFFRIYDQCR